MKVFHDIAEVKTLVYGMTREEIEGLSSVTEAQTSRMVENLLRSRREEAAMFFGSGNSVSTVKKGKKYISNCQSNN
ncbi:hypothetical protein NRP93_003746 [Clostridium botulinum]|nr:hypothetical protein [Clostridium botulinum]